MAVMTAAIRRTLEINVLSHVMRDFFWMDLHLQNALIMMMVMRMVIGANNYQHVKVFNILYFVLSHKQRC